LKKNVAITAINLREQLNQLCMATQHTQKHTETVLRPALLDFVRVYPGELASER